MKPIKPFFPWIEIFDSISIFLKITCLKSNFDALKIVDMHVKDSDLANSWILAHIESWYKYISWKYVFTEPPATKLLWSIFIATQSMN